MYGLFGSMVAKPGQGDALEGYLLEAAAGLGAVAGCLLYVVNRDLTDPDVVWVYEAWRTAQDHEASLHLETTQALIAQARPLIAEMGARYETQPTGGKGLPAS